MATDPILLASERRALLKSPESPGLGPGPRAGVATPQDLARGIGRFLKLHPLPRDAAVLFEATVRLWHDDHNNAHERCQSIETPDGSWVHGLLHRREPDYGNAAYWYRRVGQHPAFEGLSRTAVSCGDPGADAVVRQVIPGGRWDALAFIAACEAHARRRDSPQERWLRAAQVCEFNALLDYLIARGGA